GCFRAGQLVSLSVLPLRRRSGRHPADAPQCHLYHFSGRSGGPHPQEPAPLLCLEGPADFAPVHPVCPGGLGLHRRGDYPGVRLLLWQLEAPGVCLLHGGHAGHGGALPADPPVFRTVLRPCLPDRLGALRLLRRVRGGVSAAAAPLPLHRPARNQRRFFQVVLLYVLPPPPAGPGLAPGRAVSLGPHDPQGPGPAGDESIGLLQKLPSPTGPAAAKREGENMQWPLRAV
ncbi:serine O-acetyltransferase EpsC, partial [Dysosmobacter welbionis]